jgi:hypothetical protein
MDQKIRVSSELRARDVPRGTKVTPRGREYTMLGLLGGWVVGGVTMYLTWNTANPAVSAIKVFVAATAGSLLGTFVSWFMPSTRQRIKVIKELKVQIEEERKIEEEGGPVFEGRTVAKVPRPAPTRGAAIPSRRAGPEAAPVPEVQIYTSRASEDEAHPVVYTSPGEPAPPMRRDIERVERPRAEGDANALLEALEQYGQSDDDHPRRKK